MTLTNFICYKIDPSKVCENLDDKLSFQTITMIFSNIDNLDFLFGCDNLQYCLEHNCIAISGNYYYKTIRRITGYNIYNDLRSYQLREIYEKLNNYIEENEDCLSVIECLIDDYDNEVAIEKYFNSLNDINFVYPSHIKILCQLFKVMYENNLCLSASY